MQIAYISHPGKVRDSNEDCILCFEMTLQSNEALDSAGLFVVADGMGGHKAGEIASLLATHLLYKSFLDWFRDNIDTITEHTVLLKAINTYFTTAITTANTEILKKARENQKLNGMGTTVTAAFVVNSTLYVASVGDSRCYIVNNKGITQITKDHSLVQEMVDSGAITGDEARVHPQKNILTRALGYDEKLDIDVYHRNIYKGDNILLCSDGLWGFVPDQTMADIVISSDYPVNAVERLVTEANIAGGPDNISAILVRPDNLPVWEEILQAETQIVKSGISSNNRSTPKNWFSFFQRNK